MTQTDSLTGPSEMHYFTVKSSLTYNPAKMLLLFYIYYKYLKKSGTVQLLRLLLICAYGEFVQQVGIKIFCRGYLYLQTITARCVRFSMFAHLRPQGCIFYELYKIRNEFFKVARFTNKTRLT